jgi:dolichol-phosphate mannosyltransferase
MQTPRQASEAPGYCPAPAGPFVLSEAAAPAAVDVSVVLPTFNEARNITAVMAAVADTLRAIEGLRFEVIVVDDDSPDETARIALDESARIPEVRVIRRTGEAGLATAVIRGWQAARGNWLAVIDADGQHPPALLSKLVEAARAGADLAVGSRHVEGGGVSDWSAARRMVSRTAQLIGLALLPEVVARVADPMSGCFIVRRSAIAGRPLNPTGYKILIEVLARGNIGRISEIGYVFREREIGQSKATTAVYMQYLQHLLRLRVARLRESRLFRPARNASTRR